ncbi:MULTISPECIES: hypothetical protein [Staphylococcus]|uniref:hypothetical protein n=1 Tax=Staphylococcus TaxID=1279 RepID=UPI001E42C267|nr:hypothetical protein [Staphylococcus gallinarum]MCD8825447.1 hypothetical protein [Staphylococcus gallinarum]
MTDNIRILPSIKDRYIDEKLYIPIAKAKYKQFMHNIDDFILKLNTILRINDELYCILYDELCMNINHDFMNFNNLTKNSLVELLEKTIVQVVEFYAQIERDITDEEEEYIELAFKYFESALLNYKNILNHQKGSADKMRGILMEALGISIFGTTNDFQENIFVWDFNAIENGQLIKVNKRETADIYYENKGNSYICEIKCRPSGVDETQIDFIKFTKARLIQVENLALNNVILHGGTADDYNFERVKYKRKLEDFTIYPKENIKELLKII